MPNRVYSCAELSLPHADMLALRKAGDLTLGIGHEDALKISQTPALKPAGISFARSANLRNWIAVAVFAVSLYLTYIAEWWNVLFGLATMLLLGKNTKKLNIEKILAAAEIDPAFYEAVRETGAWLYRIDEAKAAAFIGEPKDGHAAKNTKRARV